MSTDIDDYRERLYKHLFSYMTENLEKLAAKPGKKVVEIKQLNIFNRYGLEISDCTLVYNTEDILHPYIFKASYKFRDFLPLNENSQTSCTIEGQTLQDTFVEFVIHIGKKIYCRDCGRLRMDTEYIQEEDQCISCVFETLLLLDKDSVEFCSICQAYTSRYTQLKCGHKFHRRCVSRILKNSCPLCSEPIDISE